MLLTKGMRNKMPRITHPRQYFQKLSQNDVIMMMIESDAQVMTEVTLHTMFIYIPKDKLNTQIALIHLLKL